MHLIQRRAHLLLCALVSAATTALSCGGDTPTAVQPSPDPVVATQTPPPTPLPNVNPASCPPLTAWLSSIYNITDGDSKVVPWIVVGGHVVIDSTPLFNGRPCNAERDACGGRKCEDPRGGVWTLVQGDSPAQPRGEGYQFRIGPLAPGVHRWRVCPRDDAMDAEGQRLVTSESACTEGSFTPLLEPPSVP